MKTTTYGKPSIGCYLDHANYSGDELDRAVIDLATRLGFTTDLVTASTIEAYDNRDADAERSNGPDDDLFDDINSIAEEAIEYLNSEESRTGLYWGHDGEAGAFGLWVSVESARDSVEFVSSEEQEYPGDDYRGEWLHVNDHGNATLYVRGNDGQDSELWSVV